MKIVRELEKGYTIIQTEYDPGWISFWIRNPHGEDVETFSSVKRAMDWWELKKKEILKVAETPAWRKARKEAEKLVKRMGGDLYSMPPEELREWIKECL